MLPPAEMPANLLRIGTAGWSIPKPHASSFPPEGSHLRRYSGRLCAVEINSSFYRPHRPATYQRWAASVPPGFLFAVKVPREITHARRLTDSAEPLDRFLAEVQELGERLGPLLIQLPPSLAFDEAIARAFFDGFRRRFDGQAVCEPRHASWFTDPAETLLARFRVARVAADPSPVPGALASRASSPGGWAGLVYYRLHGSPRIYYSGYDASYLAALARAVGEASQECWCIFDNTAAGEAAHDALALLRCVSTKTYGAGTGSAEE